jgi:hypothetical protein
MSAVPLLKCLSIQSKKNPENKCNNNVTKGEFCSKHSKSKIRWIKPSVVLTRAVKLAGLKLLRWFQRHINPIIYKKHGPATFFTGISNNPTDIYTLEPIDSIPMKYRFSYKDIKNHVWLFDIRFLTEGRRYSPHLINHFTHEPISGMALDRFHVLVESLTKSKVPILYTDNNILTSEQIWNQKVLDVFLRISSHGYAVNVNWFDNLTVELHSLLYQYLYNGWMYANALTEMDRERIVPKWKNMKSALFRWHPNRICNETHELKWWKKQNLYILNAFLTRSEDKATQGVGAIYVLTAFAKVYPSVRESFPWLVIDDTFAH